MTESLIDRRTGIFLALLFVAVVLVPAGNLIAEPGERRARAELHGGAARQVPDATRCSRWRSTSAGATPAS